MSVPRGSIYIHRFWQKVDQSAWMWVPLGFAVSVLVSIGFGCFCRPRKHDPLKAFWSEY